MRKGTSGFTIVELLIVIVVIAILATISIVAYNGIQNRAYDGSVQSDLKALATKLEMAKIDSVTSTYPNDASVLGFKATKSAYLTSGTTQNLSYCFTTDRSGYTVVAKAKSGTFFYISSLSTTPKISTGTWNGDANATCNSAEPGVATTNNYRGYAAEDTVNGPWRAWVGGN